MLMLAYLSLSFFLFFLCKGQEKEKKQGGVNPVFEFKQGLIHSAYILHLYSIFHDLGFSNLSYPIPY